MLGGGGGVSDCLLGKDKCYQKTRCLVSDH